MISQTASIFDEIPDSGFGRGCAFISLCGKCFPRNGKFVAEKANLILILFGFEVVIRPSLAGDRSTDELGGVAPAITQIFAVDLTAKRL